jgi:hypothetical protein
MSSEQHQGATISHPHGIDHSSSAPPVTIPVGHVGEFVIPGTGRRVWWTGRVAIGLLHQPEHSFGPTGSSSLWIQDLLLGKSNRHSAGHA